jgi:hypothetical protein
MGDFLFLRYNRFMYVAHTPSEHKPDVWHSLKDHLDAVAELCFEYGKNINLPLK